MVSCIICHIGTNNYEKTWGFVCVLIFFLIWKDFHLGWRDGVFVFFFNKFSAVFIEICIILRGDAATVFILLLYIFPLC